MLKWEIISFILFASSFALAHETSCLDLFQNSTESTRSEWANPTFFKSNDKNSPDKNGRALEPIVKYSFPGNIYDTSMGFDPKKFEADFLHTIRKAMFGFPSLFESLDPKKFLVMIDLGAAEFNGASRRWGKKYYEEELKNNQVKFGNLISLWNLTSSDPVFAVHADAFLNVQIPLELAPKFNVNDLSAAVAAHELAHFIVAEYNAKALGSTSEIGLNEDITRLKKEISLAEVAVEKIRSLLFEETPVGKQIRDLRVATKALDDQMTELNSKFDQIALTTWGKRKLNLYMLSQFSEAVARRDILDAHIGNDVEALMKLREAYVDLNRKMSKLELRIKRFEKVKPKVSSPEILELESLINRKKKESEAKNHMFGNPTTLNEHRMYAGLVELFCDLYSNLTLLGRIQDVDIISRVVNSSLSRNQYYMLRSNVASQSEVENYWNEVGSKTALVGQVPTELPKALKNSRDQLADRLNGDPTVALILPVDRYYYFWDYVRVKIFEYARNHGNTELIHQQIFTAFLESLIEFCYETQPDGTKRIRKHKGDPHDAIANGNEFLNIFNSKLPQNARNR